MNHVKTESENKPCVLAGPRYGRLLLTRDSTRQILSDRGIVIDEVLGSMPRHEGRPRIVVQFAYGDREFLYDWMQRRSEPVIPLTENGQRYQVVRDEDAEDRMLAELMEYGLIEKGPLLGELFQDEELDDSPEALFWLRFVEQLVPELAENGWEFTSLDDWYLDVIDGEVWQGDITERTDGSLDLDLYLDHSGERIPLVPALLAWFDDPIQHNEDTLLVPLDTHRYARIRRSFVQPILDMVTELLNRESKPVGTMTLQRADLSYLVQLDELILFSGGEAARERAQRLAHLERIEVVAQPQGLRATLRPYQQTGLNWLQFLREYGFNGILADDMGLGKTLQTLAHLLLEKEQGRLTQPALIIVPTSLLGNWHSEASRFTPGLACHIHHGTYRDNDSQTLKGADLVVTSYSLAWRDETLLRELDWSFIILDEAQAIKNPEGKKSKAIFGLRSQHRLCLTGTPLANHLGDIWSLMNFLMPGFLGSLQWFKEYYRTPIEKYRDGDRSNALGTRLAPFMLRRTKDVVARELPAKTEITQYVALEGDQKILYDGIRAAKEERVRRLVAEKGLANSHIEILDALLKLRQACCDPSLLKIDSAKAVTRSAKLDWLIPALIDMVEEGRKVLVFSSFSSMLTRIETEFKEAGITYSKLTGQTRNRDAAIEAFQEGDAKVFLITLKAGGVGLNLTAADTVIHFDPWWNPQAEAQATDRAYRIGQDKPVFVYKLVAEGTVEDWIIGLQKRKKDLADRLLSGSCDGSTLDTETLLSLFEA